MAKKFILEDDIKESVGHMFRHRLPWLTLGLLGGMATTVIVSKYEDILSADLRLAFFIPVIVYMSDAFGTQTETIFVRHLAKHQTSFLVYFIKEAALGAALGSLFGLILGLFATWWLGSSELGFTVGLAMFINLCIAPLVALIIPSILNKEKTDPALGAGPFSTVLQDLISLLVYFLVASLIII